MGILDSAELLLQAKNYSGSGAWLDEANSHDAQFGSGAGADTNDPQVLAHTGNNYLWLPGVAGNNITVTLAATTIYDYTVTYDDNTTDTGTETSDGSGVVTFGDTNVKFDSLKTRLIDVTADGGGATLALFDASLATEPFASFTDTLSKVWTFNRSGSGMYLVDRPAFGLHTDDYFVVPNDPGLDFDATGSFTTMILYRPEAVPAASASVLINRVATDGYRSYLLDSEHYGVIFGNPGAVQNFLTVGGATRELTTATVRVDRTAQELTAFSDGVAASTPSDISAVGTLTNSGVLYIGRHTNEGTQYLFAEVMAVALWRSALTDAQIVEAKEALESGVGAPSSLLLGVG